MPNVLLVNQPFVSVGLGSTQITVPSAGIYNVNFSATVPSALPTGDGAGSGTGLGSGAGGGDQAGFARGGLGTGSGGVGQGFGPNVSGYPQPLASGSNQTSGAAISSGLVVTITKNASLIYTSPVLAVTQGEVGFRASFPFATSDAVVILLASANANDSQLNTVKSITTFGQGA